VTVPDPEPAGPIAAALGDLRARMALQERSLCILTDTREQRPLPIPTSVVVHGRRWTITTSRATLGEGDYAVAGWSGRDGEHAGLLIERKAHVDELAGCFASQRDRFRREWERAQRFERRVLLVVGSPEDIWLAAYRARIHPAALTASLDSWSERYGFLVRWAQDERDAAEYVAKAAVRFLEHRARMNMIEGE